jgi:hypothetical protein
VLQPFATTLVEVLDAEVMIHLAAAEEVVDDDKDRVAESDSCLLLAAAGGEPTVLRSEVGAPASAERVGGFNQSRTQLDVAFASPATLALAGALQVARAHPAHVARCAALGKRRMSVPISATRISAMRCPMPGMVSKRSSASAKGRIRSAISALTRATPSSNAFDVAQLLGEQETLVSLHPTGQSSLQ